MAEVFYSDIYVGPGDTMGRKLQRLVDAAGLGELDLTGQRVGIKLRVDQLQKFGALSPQMVKALGDYLRARGAMAFICDSRSAMDLGPTVDVKAYLEELGFGQAYTGLAFVYLDGEDGQSLVDIPMPGSEEGPVPVGTGLEQIDVLISFSNLTIHPLVAVGGVAFNLANCGPWDTLAKAMEAKEPISKEEGKSYAHRLAERAVAAIRNRSRFHIALATNVVAEGETHPAGALAVVPPIGLLASYDMLSLDKAMIDEVNKAPVMPMSLLDGREQYSWDHFGDVWPNVTWEEALQRAEDLGGGNRDYRLIPVP